MCFSTHTQTKVLLSFVAFYIRVKTRRKKRTNSHTNVRHSLLVCEFWFCASLNIINFMEAFYRECAMHSQFIFNSVIGCTSHTHISMLISNAFQLRCESHFSELLAQVCAPWHRNTFIRKKTAQKSTVCRTYILFIRHFSCFFRSFFCSPFALSSLEASRLDGTPLFFCFSFQTRRGHE